MADEQPYVPELRTAGGPAMDAWVEKRVCQHCLNALHQCVCDPDGMADGHEPEPCAYCNGSGQYDDATTCPWCDGDGTELY